MQKWKLVAAGSTAAGVVVLGGGVAYGAATGTGSTAASPQTSASPQAQQKQNGKKVRPLVRRAVHGTVTVRTKKGFKQVQVQRGTVTAASPTKITVTSPDKWARTYTLNSATRVRLNKQKSDRNHVAKGQHVYVVTSPQSGTSVAKHVVLRSS